MTSPSTKSLRRACPVCCASTGAVLHTQEYAAPDELQTQKIVDIVACRRCGMVFADLELVQAALDKVYEEHSKYADTTLFAAGDGRPGHGVTREGAASDDRPDDGDAGDGHAFDESAPSMAPEAPWDLDRLEATAAYLAERVPDRHARILDAGCATGSLLGYLAGHGFTNLVGLDPSPVAIATARRVHGAAGVRGVVGSFVTPPPDLGQFDLVMLTHVFEHLSDVQAAAESLAALVRPGGLAYLETPDASRYAELVVAPFHDFNTEHINHFSVGLLASVAQAHGFEGVDTGSKTVMCSPRHPYPAAYGLFRRVETGARAKVAASAAADWVGDRDLSLEPAIRDYVEASRTLMDRIDTDLRAQLGDDRQVALWGAGQLAMKLLCDTVLADCDVVAVVDGSPQKHGLQMGDRVVEAPEVLVGRSLPVVIASIHHGDAIVTAMRSRVPDARPIRLSER